MDSSSSCPLCGGANECGIAEGKSTCWCFSATIAPEVLARVPEDQRNVNCICRTCAEAKPASVREPSARRLVNDAVTLDIR